MLQLFLTFINSAMANRLTPVAATDAAKNFDALYIFLLWASGISCVLVIGGFIYFALKYKRRSAKDKTAYISHNSTLEFLWSFIPFVIFMVAFFWGWYVFNELRIAPENALETHVNAQKWAWNFQYKSGKSTDGEFFAPVGTNVKLIMTSKDVLHSLYIPAFRIKQDVVPGTYFSTWFRANKPGTYQIFCTEYCGDMHSSMLAKLHVLPVADYEKWISQGDPYENMSMADVGAKVFAGKCVACHSTGTNKVVGPGLKGVFGRMEAIEEGGEVMVDENYLRESILVPTAKTVKGYIKGTMNSFQGQLNEKEMAGLIEYIKTLK